MGIAARGRGTTVGHLHQLLLFCAWFSTNSGISGAKCGINGASSSTTTTSVQAITARHSYWGCSHYHGRSRQWWELCPESSPLMTFRRGHTSQSLAVVLHSLRWRGGHQQPQKKEEQSSAHTTTSTATTTASSVPRESPPPPRSLATFLKEVIHGLRNTNLLPSMLSVLVVTTLIVSMVLVVGLPPWAKIQTHPTTRVLSSYYVYVLLGTSVVWYLFFYLLSIGYAMGIGLPCAIAMLQHNNTNNLVTWHGVLVVLWSLRLTAFLLYREHVAWPAWKVRMRQVAQQQKQQQRRIQQSPLSPNQRTTTTEDGGGGGDNSGGNSVYFLVTAGSWIVYSFLYWCMALPVLTRIVWMDNNQAAPSTWLVPSFLTVLLQIMGLTLETVADWQKTVWKATSPHEWCTIGLWKYSTHPNYLGEFIFWMGTYLSGLTKGPMMVVLPPPGGQSTQTTAAAAWTTWILTTAAMTLGFVFIASVLQGAIQTLDSAQYAKYAGRHPNFVEFQSRTTLWGPRWWRWEPSPRRVGPQQGQGL